MTLWQNVLVTAVLNSLVVQANFVVARADEIADGEREFVQQLLTRQFFDLAEQFCVRQSEHSSTPDERAAWQIMLADSRAEHAWTLQEPGRTQILTHAVESITEFVRKESPSAELDLLLRVRQIEILSTIAIIETKCAEFGPKIAPQPLATQAIAEGLQLAEAMLLQIVQIRKDIESDVARAARDRTRYVVAELMLMQAAESSGCRSSSPGGHRGRATHQIERRRGSTFSGSTPAGRIIARQEGLQRFRSVADITDVDGGK